MRELLAAGGTVFSVHSREGRGQSGQGTGCQGTTRAPLCFPLLLLFTYSMDTHCFTSQEILKFLYSKKKSR